MLMLVVSCAQVVRPTGGNTDTEPPKVVKFLPENKSLNFNTTSFNIQFDEFFVVKDATKQWIISPPLKRIPEYKIKGKVLNITFDDTLKENTTYNFNFGKSIADIHEGNAAQGLSYIFSTGSFIDSLELSGSIVNANKNTPEKDFLVMLYELNRCTEDSFPYKLMPDYFALSDASGNYKINYIKPGTYKGIVLKDANSNYLFDSYEEVIGFCDNSIHLNSNLSLDFKVFQEEEYKHYLKNKYSPQFGTYTLVFNKPLPQLEIKAIHKTSQQDWAYAEYSKGKDTVSFYLKDFSIDTLKLVCINNHMAFDTVEFAVISKEKYSSSGKRKTSPKAQLKVIPASGAEKDLNIPLGIIAMQPILKINTDSIKLLEGNHEIPFKIHKKDSLGKRFELDCKLINDSNYKLVLLPGAFYDCFGNTNDTLRSGFKVPLPESLGNFFLRIVPDSSGAMIDLKEQQLVFQLLNEKGEPLNSKILSNYETLEYLNLKPGIYKARIIVDVNKNGEWDTGNLLKKRQAEPIIFKSGTMNLRANWDLEEEWIIKL